MALAVAMLLGTVAVALADFTPKDWRYWKAIALPQLSGGEEMVELPLDRDVFGGAASFLVDLRVIADESQEAPSQLRVETYQREQTSLPVQMRDLAHLLGQYTTFVADLGEEGLLHNEIDIMAANRAGDFRRGVVVEASRDGQAWLLLRADGEIFELPVLVRGVPVRDTTVSYPQTTVRYLRVRISNKEGEPLSIGAPLVFYVKETPATLVEYPATALENRVDRERKATVVVLDMSTQGLPASHLEVEVSEKNFYREADLEGSNDRKTWTPLGKTDALYAYDTPQYVSADLTVDYPLATYRYLRLSVFNQDNPPLAVSGVKVMGPRHLLLFPARPEVAYRLYYGNEETPPPSYDLAQYLQYLETRGLPQARLETQQLNPLFVERLPPVSERFPWLLPAIVIGAMGTIALFLARLLLQTGSRMAPPS
ncbi:MAG: DUF3999 family protein [Dehalococcoidia bacterium]|nr:DUF3999 family protein [Dehalococcoidia bacterium]